MSDLLLYNYFRSSTSYRVRIALHWKELNYEYKPVHLLKDGGEQHKPEYLHLNPMGGVPTLVHAGKALSQSMAIIEYLDEIFPHKPLFPKIAFERAKVRQICENINCEIHPLQNLRVLQYLEEKAKFSDEQKNKWLHHWMAKGLEATEQLLKQTAGTYCYGYSITAADLFLVPQLFTAERFKVNLSPYPTIEKIQKACATVEAFKKAHPFRQPDTPNEYKIS